MAARIRELQVAAATHDGELGVVVWAVRSLNSSVAACKVRVNAAATRASETLDKMSKLRALGAGPIWTVGGERACVAELVDVDLIRVQ